MNQELFNQAYLHQQYWMLGIEVLTLFGVSFFAFLQYKINDRLRKLEDYVAISIIPDPNGKFALQFINAGKINLYLKKYEIDNLLTFHT